MFNESISKTPHSKIDLIKKTEFNIIKYLTLGLIITVYISIFILYTPNVYGNGESSQNNSHSLAPISYFIPNQTSVEHNSGSQILIPEYEQNSETDSVGGSPESSQSQSKSYGVHFHPTYNNADDQAVLDHLALLGVDTIRLGVSWRLLEPTENNYETFWYIPTIQNLTQSVVNRGMKVLVVFGENPCWVADNPTAACASGNYDFWCPENDIPAYADAFAKLVEELDGIVYDYEIWNEPNIDIFWCGVAATPVEYVDILQQAYTAGKAEDPNIIVYGGAVAGTHITYIDDLYLNGIYNHMDIFSVHPYTGTAEYNDCTDLRWSFTCGLEDIRDIQVAYSQTPEIAITEMGWSSYTGWGGVTETQQADYLEDALIHFDNTSYLESFVYYDAKEEYQYAAPGRDEYFGLMRSNNAYKPVYYTYQNHI